MSTPNNISLENPLAIIGSEDIILGFKALGFKAYIINEPGDVKNAINDIVKNNEAICLVEEEIYKSSKDSFDNYRTLPLPIFIPFSKMEKDEILTDIIKNIRLRATGTV